MSMRYLCSTVAVLAVCLTPTSVRAQSNVETAVTGIGLVSVQPETGQGGGHYFRESVEGTVPGFGLGLSVVGQNGAALSIEYSNTSTMSRALSSEVVSVCPCVESNRDALLSFLGGYRQRVLKGEVIYLGGLSHVGGASSDTTVDKHDFAITGGIDFARHLSKRVALAISGKYSRVRREPGVVVLSHHILRFGAGIRVRLSG